MVATINLIKLWNVISILSAQLRYNMWAVCICRQKCHFGCLSVCVQAHTFRSLRHVSISFVHNAPNEKKKKATQRKDFDD